MIARRLVAFDHDGHIQLAGGFFDQRHQIDVAFKVRQRWHKDVDFAITRLDAHGGAHQVFPAIAIAFISRTLSGLGLRWGRIGLSLQCHLDDMFGRIQWAGFAERIGFFHQLVVFGRWRQAVQRQAQANR